jgi:hypothetical protein
MSPLIRQRLSALQALQGIHLTLGPADGLCLRACPDPAAFAFASQQLSSVSRIRAISLLLHSTGYQSVQFACCSIFCTAFPASLMSGLCAAYYLSRTSSWVLWRTATPGHQRSFQSLAKHNMARRSTFIHPSTSSSSLHLLSNRSNLKTLDPFL